MDGGTRRSLPRSRRALPAVTLAAFAATCCHAITTPFFRTSPPIAAAAAEAKQLQATLLWEEVTPKKDVYMSVWMSLGAQERCTSGYLGAQFLAGGQNMLLWSMSGQEEGQVIPVGKYCHYDCFDCSPPNKRDFQCKREDYALKVGVSYKFTMQMEMQNSSGAMWSVTMQDPTSPDKGHPVEIGRVFFLDRQFNLPADNCRTLGLGSYAFQEYFTHSDLYFTTKATWSHIRFSGRMRPDGPAGFCDDTRLAELQALSLAECTDRCAADERCRYASYAPFDPYAEVDGSHCLLFERCPSKSAYLADRWQSYAKQDVRDVSVTGFDPLCERLPDETGKRTYVDMAAVRSPGIFEFQAGPNVECVNGRKLSLAPTANLSLSLLLDWAKDEHSGIEYTDLIIP